MKRFLTALVVMALMFAVPSFATVTIETNRVQYNCNGTTTAYTYPFEILEDDDLLVITANSAGSEATLTLNTDYTVAGEGTSTGGTMTLTAGSKCPSGSTLTMLRNIELQQQTDYVDGAAFSAESLEGAIDKQMLIIQQMNEKLNRVPMVKKSTTLSSVPMDLPVAGQYLRWNADGTGIESTAYVSSSGTYTPSGTGATARTVDAKLSDIINVKDYGAACDDVTDDTAAIQYALNRGGIVMVPNSTCRFTNLTITVPVELWGQGWGSVLKTTMSGVAATAPAVWIQASNVTVRDLKITWATLPTALVANTSIEQNDVLSVGYNISDTDAGTSVHNTLIDHVYILGGKQHGISVGKGYNTTIRNSRVENVYGTGIWTYYARALKITGNYIYDTKDEGIGVQANAADSDSLYSENNIIEGNVIEHGYANGIGMRGTYGGIIANNIIDDTWLGGIIAKLDTPGGHTIPSKLLINGNIIRRPFQNYGAGEYRTQDAHTTTTGTYGIMEVFGTDEAIISNNIIYDNSGLHTNYRGIWAGSPHLTLTGNNMETDVSLPLSLGGYSDATDVDQVDYLTVTGNNVVISSGNGQTALYLNGVASGVVNGNTFDCGGQTLSEPNGRFAVANYSEDVLITGNKVLNNTGAGYSNAAGSSKIVLKGNYGVYDYPTPYFTDMADTAPTLTIAEILKGIIYGTPTAGRAYTLPTGTLADASGYFALYGTFDWSIINLGAQNITLTADTGHTIVGNAVVSGATSAGWRTQKTAQDTFITYRIH